MVPAPSRIDYWLDLHAPGSTVNEIWAYAVESDDSTTVMTTTLDIGGVLIFSIAPVVQLGEITLQSKTEFTVADASTYGSDQVYALIIQGSVNERDFIQQTLFELGARGTAQGVTPVYVDPGSGGGSSGGGSPRLRSRATIRPWRKWAEAREF